MHTTASDDAVLLEHLQLANQQLRQVLASAGCNLPAGVALPPALQLQEEEAMAVLAEENYQLRQLLQQLQHQQQLQELEQQLLQQQEHELNRSTLEFDRLSPTAAEEEQLQTPLAARTSREAEQQQYQQQQLSPSASGPAALPASPAAAARPTHHMASPVRGASVGVSSPAVARLLAAAAPPSLNTVQLVEAEAAAQLATQTAIQAEAKAYQDSISQQQSQQQQFAGLLLSRETNPEIVPAQQEEEAGRQQHAMDHWPAAAFSTQQHEGGSHHPQAMMQQERSSSTQHAGLPSLALPQLPRLMLPAAVTGRRRSSDSTCSDAARSSLCSPGSGELTWRSQATTAGATSHPPASATAAAASGRSNASTSSCGGLKQLMNDLLLLPSSLQASVATAGPEAMQETFGAGAAAAGTVTAGCAVFDGGSARSFAAQDAGAAAGLAADAAAGVWHPSFPSGPRSAGVSSSGSGRAHMAMPGSSSADVVVGDLMHTGRMGADQGVDQTGSRGPPAAAAAAAEADVQLLQTRGAEAASSSQQDARGNGNGKPKPSVAQSAFATSQSMAAAALAADFPDIAVLDQQQQPQQQQQQPQQQLDCGVQTCMPALPPIATTSSRSSSGWLPSPAAAHPGAAAASQAAAAAAAFARQSFDGLPQQQQQPLPTLRLPPRVQTQHDRQQQQQQVQQRSSFGSVSSGSDIPASLPRLRLPAQRHPTSHTAAAATAAAEAGVAGTGPQGAGSPARSGGSYNSSADESPCSDSAFFRAADAGLFDVDGGRSGLWDAGTDLFGARISMDDSGQCLSTSEAQPSQLPDVPEDYFGLPEWSSGAEGGSVSAGCSVQSGWLGVSYQQSYRTMHGGSGWGSARCSQELQPLYEAESSEGGDVEEGWHSHELLQHSAAAGPSAAGAGATAGLGPGGWGYLGATQGGTQPPAAAASTQGHQQQQQQQELLGCPNLAPLKVSTNRQQQDQTPPLTWQPQQPPRTHSSGGGSGLSRGVPSMLPGATAAAAAAAASSPAHMAAEAEAAEAAASVGLAAAAAGGMDSQQLQQLLHHLARVAEEATSNVTTAAGAAAAGAAAGGVPGGRGPAAPVPRSAQGVASAAPMHGVSAVVGTHLQQQEGVVQQQQHGVLQQQHQQGVVQQQQQQQDAVPKQQQDQQQPAVADADCVTPVARAGPMQPPGAQQQPQRAQSPFASSAGLHSPARAPAGSCCLVLSPRPPALLQRTHSAGQMGRGAAEVGLPPKWGARSGSSSNLSGLLQQQQSIAEAGETSGHAEVQHGAPHPAAAAAGASAAAAAAANARTVPERAATMPVPAGPGSSLISPRLGLHSRLRVITHAAGTAGGGASSNGSNSDADAGSTHTTPMHGSTHTTPMHRPPQGFGGVPRTGSGSSFRLTSITVPPSPASSGVRYVPASPRVVGFEPCPVTPHTYTLRSPSWRSNEGGLPQEGAGVAGGPHSAFAGGSGSSTPRRQASSPGLLQQALARSGQQQQQGQAGSAAGSGSNTPCSASATAAARRAASAGLASAAGSAAGYAAAAAVDRPVHEGGSDSSSTTGLLKQGVGSCSSSALLLTMMGGQLPLLHHQRTGSSPRLDALQSPGSARRHRGGSSGFMEAFDSTGAAAAVAAEPAGELDSVAAGGGDTAAAAAAATAAAAGQPSSSHAASQEGSSSSGSSGNACRSAKDSASVPFAATAAPEASTAALGAQVPQLRRSVSPQLRARSSSRSVSPHKTDATDTHPKLSRFGIAAAARASTDKLGCSSNTSSSQQQGQQQQQPAEGHCISSAGVDAAHSNASVALPDTPALDGAGDRDAATFCDQASSSLRPSSGVGPNFSGATPSAVVEQELQQQQQQLSWVAADVAGCAGVGCCEHAAAPMSPCTPQQEAGQQQQPQQSPHSPERPPQQQQQHCVQAVSSPLTAAVAAAGMEAAPGDGLDRSGGVGLMGGRPDHSSSDSIGGGGSTDAAAAAGASSSAWSPTHDVRSTGSRHRSPSALLKRLSRG